MNNKPSLPAPKFVTKTVVVPTQRVKMRDPRPTLRLTFERKEQQTIQEALEVSAKTILAVKGLAEASGFALDYSEENARVVEGVLLVDLKPTTDDPNNAELLRGLIRTMQTSEWRERVIPAEDRPVQPRAELIPAMTVVG
jgi:hypothetical protein